MTLAYADAINTARLAEIGAAMDAGTTGALIRIYDGAQPAKGGTVTNLLAELTCSTTAFVTNTGGVATFDTITDETSAPFAGTNTATWFRIVDSDLNFVMDGTVGAGSGDLSLNSTSITQGQTVSINSWTITAGND